MNKKIARQWVEALRSGNYVQGTNVLTEVMSGKDRDCCLGVLCKLTSCVREDTGIVRYYYKKDNSYDKVPYVLADDLGMRTNGGQLPFTDRFNVDVHLYILNDSGFTFSQIADLIENFWEWI